MNKKLLVFLFVFLFCLSSVLADGYCKLNKNETYHLGETASFTCQCSAAQEENRAGYIVWFNDSTILQSTAVSSGSCISNFFGDSFVFTSNNIDNGSVIFSSNADGTGTPISWGDVGDVREDFFNLSNISIGDCIISDIKVPSVVTLGLFGGNSFVVTDGISGERLEGAYCRATALSAEGTPLLIDPAELGISSDEFLTDGSGEGFLYSYFDKEIFDVDTTYEFKLSCSCNNFSGRDCVLVESAVNSGYKSCSITGLFTTGSDDYRNRGDLLSIVLTSIFVVIVFAGLGLFSLKFGAKNEDSGAFWFSIGCFGVMLVEILFLVGIIFIDYKGLSLATLLSTNFYVMLILGFLIGFGGLFLLVMKIFRWKDDGKNTIKW